LLDLARVGEPLDRVDFAAVGLDREHETPSHDLAFDAHGARAAHAVLAAEVGAGQFELDPQEVGEAHARGNRALDALAVDDELDLYSLERGVHWSCESTRPASTFARCSVVSAEAGRPARASRSPIFETMPSTVSASTTLGRSPTPKKAARTLFFDPCAATPTMA